MKSSTGRRRINKMQRQSKNRLRIILVVFLLIASSGVLLSQGLIGKVSSAGQTQNRISAEVVDQIRALQAEKESRTPAQRKIDSQLIYATKMHRGEAIAEGVQSLTVDVGADKDGFVTVDISATIDEALLAQLKGLGVEYSNVSARYHSLRAVASLDQLESIASIPQVRFIQPKQEAIASQDRSLIDAPVGASRQARVDAIRQQLEDPISNAFLNGVMATSVTPGTGLAGVGSAESQGDIAHKAYSARGTFNVDGTGIRIGVLSDGVTNLAAAQASGDIPPTCSSLTPPATEKCVNVVPGQTGSGDEGTAMLELIHDVAPGAQLYFATAFTSITSFATNINTLRNTYNCDIIVDDVGYFVESPFQDGQTGAVVSNTNGGIVTQAVNDVVASGALYFSSAANSGNKNDNTSGTWEGDFADGGTIALISGTNHVHDFDPSAGVAQSDLILQGGGNPINVYWSDPLGGSSNDYDLFILNNASTAIIASSTNIQSGTQDPYEQVPSASNAVNNRVVVVQKAGAANRFLHVGTNRGRLSLSTQGETHGHNAASGAYGVAAVCAACIFPPPAFDATRAVETFSSDGPRHIFYNANSTAITPGDVSSTGGATLQKPDLTAADGASISGAGNFANPFFGTSAAAPHAAAIAGLLKSFNPAFTKPQITTFLSASGLDIETPGVDRDAGFGIIMPYTALQAAGATGQAFLEVGGVTTTETCCNANGLIEPGEGGTMSVTLTNTGLLTATGITATLTSPTVGVSILNGTSAYTNLAASGGTAANTTNYLFSLQRTMPADPVVNFTLTINYTNGWTPSQVYNFSVQLGRNPILTSLGGAAPPTSPSYPTTGTATQTDRITRNGVQSVCGAAKPFPGITTPAGALAAETYTLTNNFNGATACVKVTLTPIQLFTNMFYAAYIGSYNPAAVNTNYLGDPGLSPAGLSSNSFFVNIPAGQTLVVVVHELPAGQGVGTSYILEVAGLATTGIPTAAPASISGVVNSPEGAGLAGVVVRLSGGDIRTAITDSEGRFQFDNLNTDNFYTVSPSLANYHFSPAERSFSLQGNRTDAVFNASANAIPIANAIDTNEYFVRQHYLDFLGREPEQGGFDYWTGQLNACGSDTDCLRSRRTEVSAAFYNEREFQETSSFVYRLYQGSLGRQLSYAEFSSDRRQVVDGPNLDATKLAFANVFVQRAEFVQKYQSGTNAASFVDALLQTSTNAGGVDLSSLRDALISKYNEGGNQTQSRALVVKQLGDNEQFAQAVFNRGFVLMEYFGYLRRDPDQGGYDFWLEILNNRVPGNFRAMVCAFITSREYQHRFSPVVTRTNQDCGP